MKTLAFASGVIGRALITLLAVSVLVFAAIHLIPGNFADLFAPPQMGPQARDKVIQTYGLNQPLPNQYLHWAEAAVTGNLGTSLVSERPVVDDLAERVPATAELTLIAMFLALVIGIPLGVAAGLGGGGRVVGLISRLVGSLGLSVPDFVLASVLVYVFSAHPLFATVGGYVPLTQDPLGNIRSILLPAVTLSLFTGTLIMRTTRDSVRSVLPETYIDAALARGETRVQIVRRHVGRNATIPVLTVAAVSVGYLLGGAVIVETIFSIPGVGQYAVGAVHARDYPVVQACVLLGATAFIVLNTLADLAYPLIDPRIGTRMANR